MIYEVAFVFLWWSLGVILADSHSARNVKMDPLRSIFFGQKRPKLREYLTNYLCSRPFGPWCCLCASVSVRMKPVCCTGNGTGNKSCYPADRNPLPGFDLGKCYVD